MLEEKDIQQIGQVVEERLMPKIGLEIGKIIEENVIPAIEELRGEVGEIKTEMGKMRAVMVTKSYLDDKLADLEGGLVGKLRKEDGKVDHLIEMLKNKSILSEQEAQQFKEYQVFPKLEKV